MQVERLQRRASKQATAWPTAYRNRATGRTYAPHHDGERAFVYSDAPKYAVALGGEGGGKSVAGIVKTLERVRRRMSGIMVSPDLPHFKRSLWPEFQNWCPWECVVPQQQYRGKFDWQPQEPFQLAFTNGAVLHCGGIEKPGSWEGPNVHFAHFDEARHATDAKPLKILDGRTRLTGPDGEPPQLYFTTTPRKHWLHEYFGPPEENDPWASFKRRASIIRLLTEDNLHNLDPEYVASRKTVLTEKEQRIYLGAEWEDEDISEKFLDSMVWWDACIDTLPPLRRDEPLVVALDAGISNDNFGIVGVTRHPERHSDIAVRYVRKWVAPGCGKIDFADIEKECRHLFASYSVVCWPYDIHQLHDMATRLTNESLGWWEPFPQQKDRLIADKQFLDLILGRRILHDGNSDLRQHVDNADRKKDADSGKLRMVKRSDSLKIDLAVACSMAAHKCLELQL